MRNTLELGDDTPTVPTRIPRRSRAHRYALIAAVDIAICVTALGIAAGVAHVAHHGAAQVQCSKGK